MAKHTSLPGQRGHVKSLKCPSLILCTAPASLAWPSPSTSTSCKDEVADIQAKECIILPCVWLGRERFHPFFFECLVDEHQGWRGSTRKYSVNMFHQLTLNFWSNAAVLWDGDSCSLGLFGWLPAALLPGWIIVCTLPVHCLVWTMKRCLILAGVAFTRQPNSSTWLQDKCCLS